MPRPLGGVKSLRIRRCRHFYLPIKVDAPDGKVIHREILFPIRLDNESVTCSTGSLNRGMASYSPQCSFENR